MAYYLFINGDSGAGNLNTLANWRNSNASGGNVSAATQLPGSSDNAFITAGLQINSGTLNASTVTPRGIGSVVVVQGGVINSAVADDAYGWSIQGGTFNGSVSLGSNSEIAGGLFNGPVSIAGNTIAIITAGTFNAAVTATGGAGVQGGTFNAPVTVDNESYASGGDGSVSPIFNSTLGFNSGIELLYSPNSSAVAPPNKVLAGTSNLGVAGTALSLSSYQASVPATGTAGASLPIVISPVGGAPATADSIDVFTTPILGVTNAAYSHSGGGNTTLSTDPATATKIVAQVGSGPSTLYLFGPAAVGYPPFKLLASVISINATTGTINLSSPLSSDAVSGSFIQLSGATTTKIGTVTPGTNGQPVAQSYTPAVAGAYRIGFGTGGNESAQSANGVFINGFAASLVGTASGGGGVAPGPIGIGI